MDLSNIPLAELKGLLYEIPAEIKRREKDEKAKLLKDLEALATERGFALNDLLDTSALSAKTKAKATVQPKYRHPSDTGLTWTGRGRQPKWVVDQIAQGATLHSLAIQ